MSPRPAAIDSPPAEGVVRDAPPDASGLEHSEAVQLVPVERIRPSARQPRTAFPENELQELAASIASVGMLEPVVVRPAGEEFELILGERRWRAAQRLGWARIPALVRDVPDREAFVRTLVENLQRSDFTPLEEARAYRVLMDEFSLTQEQAADRVGRERTTVANALRLLKLSAAVQLALQARKLSAGHARAVLMLESAAEQESFAQRIQDEGWNVRQAEAEAARQRGRGPSSARPRARAVPTTAAARGGEFDRIEAEVRRAVGTKVRIRPRTGDSGTVEIEYYSLTDLDRIYRRLAGT